jgi:hypothetical protein
MNFYEKTEIALRTESYPAEKANVLTGGHRVKLNRLLFAQKGRSERASSSD